MTANTPTPGGIPLYSAAQMRELDRLAIEAAGIPGYTLMNRAADAAWAALRSRWPQARTLAVLCGAGNNGGDGFVLARLARADDRSVRVLQLGDEQRIRGDALTARAAWLEAGGGVEPFTAAALVPFAIALVRVPPSVPVPVSRESANPVVAVTLARLPYASCDSTMTVNAVPAAGLLPPLTDVTANCVTAPGFTVTVPLVPAVSAGPLVVLTTSVMLSAFV